MAAKSDSSASVSERVDMEADDLDGDVEDFDDSYVLYRDRSEWSDVRPISADEGTAAVVQIDYTPKFSDVYDYFRGVLKIQDHSPRVLTLTSDAIMLNAANYTVWQYRRDVLEALGVPSLATKDGLSPQFVKEFTFSKQSIEYNQKNYQVWHHRKCLVSWAAGYQEETEEVALTCEEAKLKLAKTELDLTEKILLKDAKNYHAWQHRQWVLKTFGVYEPELEYVTGLIGDDVRNNSAWNERYFVLSNMPNLTKTLVDNEFDFTWNQISFAMSNESPWNYMGGLLLLYKKLNDAEGLAEAKENLWDKCENYFKSGNTSIPLMGFIVDLTLDFLHSGNCSETKYLLSLQICDILLEKDCTRKQYWDYIRKQIDTLWVQLNLSQK